MDDSVLVVVHPDYSPPSGFIDRAKYGDYDRYTSRLKEAIWSADRCVLFMCNPESKIQVPENMEVVYDIEGGCDVRPLVPRLRKMRPERVELCGEMLWYYTNSEEFMEVEEIMERLPPRKRTEFREFLEREEMLTSNLLVDLDSLESIGFVPEKRLETPKVNGACVVNVQRKLEKHFPVVLRRELCYPTKDPIVVEEVD